MALNSCSQNDPIREKERLIASGNINKGKDGKNEKDEKDEPTPPKEEPESPKENEPKPTDEVPNKPTDTPKDPIFMELLYSFEYWGKLKESDLHSRPLLRPDEDITNSYWISASNMGYNRVPGKKTEDMYPVLKLEQGYQGAGVLLRSVKGFYLSFFDLGTNLVAGSLYAGAVNTKTLATKPLESTLFGHAWDKGIPTELKLFYQYKSGEKVIFGQDQDSPLASNLPQQDQGSISGVLYETTNDKSPLNGKNVNKDPRIVARAHKLIDPSNPADQWLELSIPFEPIDQEAYQQIDFSKKTYALSIIFSSSARGDEYIGAVGSELRIDEVKLIYKK